MATQDTSPYAADLPSALSQQARTIGCVLARRLFKARGNHSEAHLTEFELAVALATAAHAAKMKGVS